ncbi:MAG: 2-amino-4-hydroxy-6-hydroxymethyldihydropteridine diphosphokinase [Candidatus Symbiothrix sp.]|jgi:2-amino-4-hydroxy-6-hydroxymethyldihydropteridine diphosphokinase|nr:2-amino-4-hydroxy-6-hydroxymethyldihydropteridine diphosphokinase [Candidatus Symbiothrix sp.]
MQQHIVYLGLGTNLGEKHANLFHALRLIAGRIGVLSALSSVYETEAWGFESPNSFLNMVIKAETALSPLEVLHATQAIEKEMGRTEKTTTAYHDRIIDIDLILYDDLNYQSEELTLPHPYYREREFVWKPLQEIMSSIRLSPPSKH